MPVCFTRSGRSREARKPDSAARSASTCTSSPRLGRVIVVVLVVFLAFDWIGASRGWFASNLDWVVAYVEPGIPPEEPLLLAFLALFSIVLFEAFRRRVTDETGAADA